MNHGIEHAKATIATFGSYSISGGLVIGGIFFDLKAIGIICGIVLGICTFLMSWYYKHQDKKRNDAVAEWHKKHSLGGLPKEAAEVSSKNVDAV